MQLDSARELKDDLLTRITKGDRLLHPEGGSETSHAELTRDRAAAFPSRRAGVAVGIAMYGKHNFGIAVHVQVRSVQTQKIVDYIRDAARGEAEVQYVGSVRFQAPPTRPVCPGISIGHPRVEAGTLGIFVMLDGSPGVHVLSNNHVLADCDQGVQGDVILQPGPVDGGQAPLHRIGTLSSAVALVRRPVRNVIDAATCLLDSDVAHVGGPLLTGLSGPIEIEEEGIPVAKVGRTTGLTRGHVTEFAMDGLEVDYPGRGPFIFDRQIVVEGDGYPFSDSGDSGALVFSESPPEAVGLLFAGSETGRTGPVTYVNPLSVVFVHLSATLAL